MRGRVRYRGEDGARERGEPTLENLRPAIMSDGLRSTISITAGGWAGARCRVKQGGAGGCEDLIADIRRPSIFREAPFLHSQNNSPYQLYLWCLLCVPVYSQCQSWIGCI